MEFSYCFVNKENRDIPQGVALLITLLKPKPHSWIEFSLDSKIYVWKKKSILQHKIGWCPKKKIDFTTQKKADIMPDINKGTDKDTYLYTKIVVRFDQTIDRTKHPKQSQEMDSKLDGNQCVQTEIQ